MCVCVSVSGGAGGVGWARPSAPQDKELRGTSRWARSAQLGACMWIYNMAWTAGQMCGWMNGAPPPWSQRWRAHHHPGEASHPSAHSLPPSVADASQGSKPTPVPGTLGSHSPPPTRARAARSRRGHLTEAAHHSLSWDSCLWVC